MLMNPMKKDIRLLKYKTDKIQIIDPIEFIRQTGGSEND